MRTTGRQSRSRGRGAVAALEHAGSSEHPGREPSAGRGLPPLWLGLVVEGVLLCLLAACTSFSHADARATAGAAGASGLPGQPGRPGEPGQPGGVTMVACSNDTCLVTLGGSGRAQALGTAFAVRDVRNGRATVRAGDTDVSLAPGQVVTAAGLTLRCTAVTADTVTFAATR